MNSRACGVLQIRRAAPGDRQRVLAIATLGMREFGIEPDFDGLDRELSSFGDPGVAPTVHLVAHIGPAVVGSLILARKDAGIVKLSAFYVDPACRGRGAGRALLAEAIGVGIALGYRTIYLETWENMAAAVRLYTSLGWRAVARLPPASGAEWAFELELPQNS